MNDDRSVRRYEPGEANDVWRVHERAFEASPIPFVPELDRDLRRIPEAYLDDGEFVVAEVDGQVVGVGGFTPRSAGTVEIKRMRVDPAFQRPGIRQRGARGARSSGSKP